MNKQSKLKIIVLISNQKKTQIVIKIFLLRIKTPIEDNQMLMIK